MNFSISKFNITTNLFNISSILKYENFHSTHRKLWVHAHHETNFRLNEKNRYTSISKFILKNLTLSSVCNNIKWRTMQSINRMNFFRRTYHKRNSSWFYYFSSLFFYWKRSKVNFYIDYNTCSWFLGCPSGTQMEYFKILWIFLKVWSWLLKFQINFKY